MKCPTCVESVLVMTARQGIEIDYCPNCRGVWLDRGELDKIVERSMGETGSAGAGAIQPGYGQVSRGDCDDRGKYGNHPQKRRGFLKDLFD
ncbi:TFIIB-type zinc ribbon-containing protein [Variovorax sp. JS1663]|uniref:TFIIB-type zinc ribbon-containing protein n=1 Tax=Variovorax sp. JS1663 TaxID=1851577 RepID=UPI000B3459CD|nr:zf-TFIIB domain-containing protein [Variovorax sp. JS1663]